MPYIEPPYPAPIPLPVRPAIKSLNRGELYGAGLAMDQTISIEVDLALPDVAAYLDGVALPSEVHLDPASPTTNYGSIKALVSMAAVTKGPHLVTVADGNGASFGGMQVLAHAA